MGGAHSVGHRGDGNEYSKAVRCSALGFCGECGESVEGEQATYVFAVFAIWILNRRPYSDFYGINTVSYSAYTRTLFTCTVE